MTTEFISRNPDGLADQLLVSGLKRHVRICDTVLNSDDYLGNNERVSLIQDLLAEKSDLTVKQIKVRCKELADQTCGNNTINAGILRRARR